VSIGGLLDVDEGDRVGLSLSRGHSIRSRTALQQCYVNSLTHVWLNGRPFLLAQVSTCDQRLGRRTGWLPICFLAGNLLDYGSLHDTWGRFGFDGDSGV